MSLFKKRLFFGWQVEVPWPELPKRALQEEDRHITFVFLGETDYEKMESLLFSCPELPFLIAPLGICDHCLFLPEKRHSPHVVAWHIDWVTQSDEIKQYHDTVIQWLIQHEIKIEEKREWMAHLTLARAPFHQEEWKKLFTPLPLIAPTFHLYESLGHSKYRSLWQRSLLLPFEEFEHVADRAFYIRGITYTQLYYHAAFALAFIFPQLLSFIYPLLQINELEEVIRMLNQLISRADQEIGTPFKAISYHSKQTLQNSVIEWEMIVDV